MNISDIYSSIAFLESPVVGQYLITIVWSISILSGYKTLLEAKISSTQLDLDFSLDLNYASEDKFFPSLFPKWLYDTIDNGLIPADTK